MSRHTTAGNPGRRGRTVDEDERPDKRDGFGGLAAAADKNATFYVHSQPVYKMAHNCSVAMSNAHLPKHALAIFGEVTQCTEFVGRALDMIPHDFGGHPGTVSGIYSGRSHARGGAGGRGIPGHPAPVPERDGAADRRHRGDTVTHIKRPLHVASGLPDEPVTGACSHQRVAPKGGSSWISTSRACTIVRRS